MRVGAKLGSERVNITDDATASGQLGHYRYDDECVKVRPVQLMKKGILTGRLHSRRTAAAMQEPVTGHCVAEDFRFGPMVRMGTIYMEPGNLTLQELMTQMQDGLYLVDPKGGETSGEGFTFGASHGWVIKNGRKTKMIRDVNMSGNLFQTLGNVAGVGNDLMLMEGGGACGKGDQANFRSCLGAPHLLINDVLVAGG
jgi:TldD protein